MSIAISSLDVQDLNLLNRKIVNKNIFIANLEQKETNNPFANIGNISMNKIDENSENLQKMAAYLAKEENLLQNKADFNAEDKDDPNKSTVEIVFSKIAQLFFSKSMAQKSSLLSKLTRPNPAMIVASILGFDTEEVGDAIKKGAVTNESKNLMDEYKNTIIRHIKMLKNQIGMPFLKD